METQIGLTKTIMNWLRGDGFIIRNDILVRFIVICHQMPRYYEDIRKWLIVKYLPSIVRDVS